MKTDTSGNLLRHSAETTEAPHRTMRNTPTRRSKKRGTILAPEARVAALYLTRMNLRVALAHAKDADAPQLAGRIRAALKSSDGALRHAKRRGCGAVKTTDKVTKQRCVCRGGTFAARGFGGAKAGGWVGSPATRKGIEGWTCDDCGRFIPCKVQL